MFEKGYIPWNKGKKGMPGPMLGKHHSEATKKKMSELHLGRHISEETKQKLRECHLGAKNYNYGKHFNHSEATKQKMREKAIGRHWSEETKKKMSESRKDKPGHPCSEEAKIKIGNANRGKHRSEEIKEKMRNRIISKETKQKISKLKTKIISEELKQKLIDEYVNGKNLKELSIEYGLSKTLIFNRFKKWGVKVRTRKETNTGEDRRKKMREAARERMLKYNPMFNEDARKKASRRQRTTGRMTHMDRVNLILERGKCEKCGNADLRILTSHHIDGNRYNNSLENLIVVCYNCHGLEHWGNSEWRKRLMRVAERRKRRFCMQTAQKP